MIPPSPTSLTLATISSTASLSSIASGSPTQPIPTGPCGSVAVLAAAQTNASSTAAPTVPAQLAYECLNSIPFNQSAAIQLLDAIDPYLQWQTTFEYVKDPPAEVSLLRHLLLRALAKCDCSMPKRSNHRTTSMLRGKQSRPMLLPALIRASTNSASLFTALHSRSTMVISNST